MYFLIDFFGCSNMHPVPIQVNLIYYIIINNLTKFAHIIQLIISDSSAHCEVRLFQLNGIIKHTFSSFLFKLLKIP
jgi:hypothetical protein